jgi:hypothetical protein
MVIMISLFQHTKGIKRKIERSRKDIEMGKVKISIPFSGARYPSMLVTSITNIKKEEEK